MNQSRLEQVVARLSGLRFLVLGDLMMDEYLWGRTERISPEAPVQVVDILKEELRLGGAGNVVNTLLTLGCQVSVVSVVGDDEDGERLLRMFDERGVDRSGVLVLPRRKTTRKTRVVASSQQMLRIDRETRETVDDAIAREMAEQVARLLPETDLVLVSDYRKGALNDSLLQRAISLCRSLGKPVLVDPKGDSFTRYRGATLITPNRKEAKEATSLTGPERHDLIAIGERFLTDLSLDAVVLTRSEEGMTIFEASGRQTHLPTEAREVFDVSGAGDTVLSLLGVGMAAGLSIPESAILANAAAGVVVAKVGTSTVTVEELRQAIDRRAPHPVQGVVERGELVEIVGRARRQGKKIVFTNGCFDLLHIGHVQYLQKARRLGDILVLGLNSDASVRRLKGPKRPLIHEDERAHLMAALDCVDYVTVFDEDTPLLLIEAVTPDILVKGGDYTPETVVGREHVEAHGGRVELIEFVDGRSTSNLVERIVDLYGGEGK